MTTDLPGHVAHYAAGAPFRSMMDLDAAGRRAVLDQGLVAGAARWADPTYVETRARVEATLYDRFCAAGGEPRCRHPHYALLGRSARLEAAPGPTRRVYLIPLARLPQAHVSFTWGDSFRFDATFRSATGGEHPASLQVYRLSELQAVLDRWGGSTGRPAWQELEIQLWFVPEAASVEVVEVG